MHREVMTSKVLIFTKGGMHLAKVPNLIKVLITAGQCLDEIYLWRSKHSQAIKHKRIARLLRNVLRPVFLDKLGNFVQQWKANNFFNVSMHPLLIPVPIKIYIHSAGCTRSMTFHCTIMQCWDKTTRYHTLQQEQEPNNAYFCKEK